MGGRRRRDVMEAGGCTHAVPCPSTPRAARSRLAALGGRYKQRRRQGAALLAKPASGAMPAPADSHAWRCIGPPKAPNHSTPTPPPRPHTHPPTHRDSPHTRTRNHHHRHCPPSTHRSAGTSIFATVTTSSLIFLSSRSCLRGVGKGGLEVRFCSPFAVAVLRTAQGVAAGDRCTGRCPAVASRAGGFTPAAFFSSLSTNNQHDLMSSKHAAANKAKRVSQARRRARRVRHALREGKQAGRGTKSAKKAEEC